MKQNRAPSVLVHHTELARRAVSQLSLDRRSDRRDNFLTGLKVSCELDAADYPKGLNVSDHEKASLNIQRADFHGEWSYKIAPAN